MKILVTGAAGRLGFAAAGALAAAGHDVLSTDRRFRAGVPGRFRRLDLLDEFAVHAALEGCEAVVHFGNLPNVGAAPTPWIVYRDNILINGHVFQAAADHGVAQVLFASSIQVCSGVRAWGSSNASELSYLPLDGNHPPNPGNLYALSKVAGEDLLRHFAARLGAFAAVAIRFPHIVDSNAVAHYRACPHHAPTWKMLDEGFSYLSLDDAAALTRALIERRPPGYRTLLPAARGNKLARSPADIIREYYPKVPLRRPPGEMESLVDVSEIERCCGWTPRDNALFDA